MGHLPWYTLCDVTTAEIFRSILGIYTLDKAQWITPDIASGSNVTNNIVFSDSGYPDGIFFYFSSAYNFTLSFVNS